ncbi:hypothetical protein [Dokdonia sp. Asnod1-B02]|uniref:hypothetical protein n=1 Tax=Dokdonia sp. Asnod1-B02 TaxID=3160573 RepID=UPI0038667886
MTTILSKFDIKEETDISYTYDAGTKNTSLNINGDNTFEYTYEEIYKGSRTSLVYIIGKMEFKGGVEVVFEKGSEILQQKIEFIGKDRDSQQREFRATLIQFKNSSGYKNELFFSGESKTYKMNKNSSSDNLKLPSQIFDFN